MTNWDKYFTEATFRYIDHSKPENQQAPMASFAIDDALAISVGDGDSAPTIRLWVHDNTVMLGIPDARLPYIEDGTEWLLANNFQPTVRNSGGLAVLLDSGVLNVSLILPDAKQLGIHDGYQMMVAFIQYLFKDLTDEIQAFEVVGSYCPGDYDLSINRKKFAGISQRRVKNGSAVQIYLCVEGDGVERAEIVKEFYNRGLRGEKGKFDYPSIVPETMASLAQLLDAELTVSSVAERIQNSLKQLNNTIVYDGLNEKEQLNFEKRLKQMKDRNQKALG